MATPESDRLAVLPGEFPEHHTTDDVRLDERDLDGVDGVRSTPDIPSQQETTMPLSLTDSYDEQTVQPDEDTLETSSATALVHSQIEHGRSSSPSGGTPESMQYQVDEQIHQEASISDYSGHAGIPLMGNQDLTHLCTRTVPPRQTMPDARSGALRVHSTPQTSPPKQADAFSASTDTNELLQVVAYKFNQQQQNVRNACSAENKRLQNDLQTAHADNEELRSHIVAVEEQCTELSENVSKYKTQIVKAKGLQKFLDGLGGDLRSLKDSFDTEKSRFRARVEADGEEIARLESALTGRIDYERMLSNSKVSLEKLLEARGFELHAVVQHRDMLRSQLDEKIGQLVEERDSRSRLQQLVTELRNSERSSLMTVFEQCARSLASKMDDVIQKGNGISLSICNVHEDIQKLSEKPSTSAEALRAIEAHISNFQATLAQVTSAEQAANTMLVDLSSAVEGIFQHHKASLRNESDHLEAIAKLDAAIERQEALQGELKKAWNHANHVESQLQVSRQAEASLNDALAASNDQIKSLSAAAVSLPAPSQDPSASTDVESKIKEAVAKERYRLSENANAFVAQEKARFSNEIKRTENERNKAIQKTKAQEEVLSRSRIELEEMQAKFKALQAELQRQNRSVSQQQCDAEELSRSRSELSESQTQIESLRKELRRQQELVSEKQSRVEELSKLRVELDEAEAQRNDLQAELHRQEQQIAEQQTHVEDLSGLRIELDEVQKQHESVRLELRERNQHDAEQRSQMKQMEESIKSFDQQCKTAQATIERHEALQKKFQLKEDERLGLQSTQQQAIESLSNESEDLRLQLDVSQTAITAHQWQEKQYQLAESEHKARESTLTSTIDGLRKDYSEAQAQIAKLKNDFSYSQQSQQMRNRSDSTAHKPDDQTSMLVQPSVSENSMPKKQRRKADRSNNTIVTMPSKHETVPTQNENRTSRPKVIAPPSANFADGSCQNGNARVGSHPEKSLTRAYNVSGSPDPLADNDMLDSVSSQRMSVAIPRVRSDTSEMLIPDSSHGFQQTRMRTPLGPMNTNGSSPEFMNVARNSVKRRYSGPHTPKDAQKPARRSATPLRDPRVVAKAESKKRSAPANQGLPLQEPPAKRQAVAANTRATAKASEGSVVARSSQSVSDLPRIEDMNRNAGKSQSSHMRSSAGQSRGSQSQAMGSKGKAYQDRFRQELRRH